jgi:death-on-curing protein
MIFGGEYPRSGARHSTFLRSEPVWLPVDKVIEINRDEITKCPGEVFHLRDRGLLESACARPRNHWSYDEDDIVALAVVLLLGIAQSHSFEQANHRTALVAAESFLEANGYLITCPRDKATGKLIRRAVRKAISEDEFLAIARLNIAELP